MQVFKKPECVPLRKVIKGNERGKLHSVRLESSVTSGSPSTSFCSQQSICSGYSYATSLFRSVIDNNISSNDSKILQDSSALHSSVKKFGEEVWSDLVNTTSEWQLQGYIEKHKEMKTRAAMAKGNLQKKMVTFERWWCILTEDLTLCIQGIVENKNSVLQTEAIIKRMDPHTVASRNSLYKLKNFSGEDCVPDLPHFIKKRFACGFPEDWKLLKKQWITFLKEGEPQDLQWKGNDNATSVDNCPAFQKPYGQPSQGRSCEEFSDRTRERNFTFSSLVANNKPTDRVLRLETNDVTVEKHGTENIRNWAHLEKEGTNHVILKRNEPHSSNSATNTKNNSLVTAFQKPSGESSQGRSCEEFSGRTRERNFAFSSLVANSKPTDRVRRLETNDVTVEKHGTENIRNWPHLEKEGTNHVIAERNEPHSSNSATNTKNNSLVIKRSYEVITDGSEISSDEDTGIANTRTNCQDAKNSVNQHGNKKQQSVVSSRTCNVNLGNEILLENWLPVLKADKLCFRGVRSVGGAKNSHTTAAVKSRLKSDTVTLVDGKKCILIGHLHDVHNSLPAEIGSKFKFGMPLHWRKVLNMWITCSNNTGEKSATRSELPSVNNQEQGTFKKSSRGRVLLQPVKHWLGETPSSVISSLLNGKKEKQEELLNSKGSHALPTEKILNDKEKCGMLNKADALPQKNVKNAANSKKRKTDLHDRNVKKSKKEQQSSGADSEKVVNSHLLGVEKELHDRNVKKSKKEKQQSSGAGLDKVVNSHMLGGSSCLNNHFENPTYFTNSERRVLRSRNKQKIVQKENSDAIPDENKNDGVGNNAVSHNSHAHNKINRGKPNRSSAVPVLDRDDKDSTSAQKRKHIMKNTNKKDEVHPLKPSDIDIDFTDFLGKPPKTLKQRKKLDKVVKTLYQKNKKNIDIFDDTSEGHQNSMAAWNDFITVNDATFNIGEETPRSKILNGSYFKTPEPSPSHSIFQITPCDNGEVLRYVHQQKTKNDKAVKKADAKKTKTKLSFIPTSSGNPTVDTVYAALLKGEPIPKHIISKGVITDSEDTFSEASF